MQRGPWLSRIAIIVGAIAVLIAAVVVIVDTGRTGSTTKKISGVASDVHRRIPVGGGVSVAAEVVTPKGSGRFPLVILPTSWGAELTEYHGLVEGLARDGYQVVTYVQRGFHQSGGEADFAGPPTQRDVSAVIDWALRNTRGDADHVGLFGTSYGAGIALLAAARDPRIKAVVATSGWADFGAVFAEHDTVSTAALASLLGTVHKTGRPAGVLVRLAETLAGPRPSDAAGAIEAMAGPRSADRMINALNRNAPAIMLASGYADSVLPPSSLVPFFERLTGPKRLQLAPGDHGAPEWSGLRGRPNPVTDEAHAWLDHYLKGTANGVDTQPAVQFTDVVTGKIRRHTRWPAATDRAMLGPPDRDGSAAPGAAATWTATIRGGVDTVADGASGAIASGRYRAPQIRLDRFDTAHGVYWTGAPVPTGTVLDGSPKLSLRVSSSTGSTSLFAYLYDVDPSGRAALMSATPYSVTGAHTAKRVSFPLGPVGWTLSKGHRLALLIDTVDPRWTSLAGPGSTVRLSSAPGAPASLDLPLAG